jgi:MFS family permease
MAVMLAGRLTQGVGGGMMVALGYIAVQVLFPERLWTRLLAVLSTLWGAASLIGPLIGGLFCAAGLWRLAFWLFAGLAALLVVAAFRFLREPRAAVPDPRALSWLPLALLFTGTLVVAEAGEVPRPTSASVAGAIGFCLLLMAAWLDGRGRPRLLPTELLDLRHPLGAGLMMVFALCAANTGFWTYGPLILKIAYGVDPLFAGVLLAGESIAWTVCTIAVASAPPRWARWLIGAGVATAAAGSSGLVLAMPAGHLSSIVLCVLLQGAGFGIAWPFLVARVIALARPEEQDLAAGAAPTMQRIGYAVGAAAGGIAANAAGFDVGASATAARAAAFWVFAAFLPLLIVALPLAARFISGRRSRPEAERLA